MVNFDNDENLGLVVDNKELFTEINETSEISKHQLDIAAGKLNISRLCGFKFHSNIQKIYPDFAIAFVCKYRSQINHQQKKYTEGQWTIPSRWFAFRLIDGFRRIMIVDIDTIATLYNFDIAKFFKSDYWKNGIVELEKTVRTGMARYDQFLRSIDNKKEQADAIDELRAIELSLTLMKKRMFENKNYRGVLQDLNLSEGNQKMKSNLYTVEELKNILSKYPNDRKIQFQLDGNDIKDKEVLGIGDIDTDTSKAIVIKMNAGYLMENVKEVFEEDTAEVDFKKDATTCKGIYEKCKSSGVIAKADAKKIRDFMKTYSTADLPASAKDCCEACYKALDLLLSNNEISTDNDMFEIDKATKKLNAQNRKSIFFDVARIAIELLALDMTKEKNVAIAEAIQSLKEKELDNNIEEALKGIYK